LVRHHRQIVIAGLVAGLVSRINMIRRPDLQRQVAILNTLAVKKLKAKQGKCQVGHAAASRKSAKTPNSPIQAARHGRKAAAPNPSSPACSPW
jgi:hypothetical protein